MTELLDGVCRTGPNETLREFIGSPVGLRVAAYAAAIAPQFLLTRLAPDRDTLAARIGAAAPRAVAALDRVEAAVELGDIGRVAEPLEPVLERGRFRAGFEI